MCLAVEFFLFIFIINRSLTAKSKLGGKKVHKCVDKNYLKKKQNFMVGNVHRVRGGRTRWVDSEVRRHHALKKVKMSREIKIKRVRSA